ncbi:MAG: FecR family protein, partial [Lysobacter sp.]
MKTMASMPAFPAEEPQGEAETWLARLLSPDCSPGDRAAFEDWLASSPCHVEEYLDAERIHSMVALLGSDDLVRAATRSAKRDARGNAVRGRRLGSFAAMAASLLLVGGAVFWFAREPTSAPTLQQYATAIGEQRTVALADGTTLLLDTDSAVTARFDTTRRVVGLMRGRVQLVVAADRERPFVVEAGASTIRDIGTTFQVSRAGDVINVGLIAGSVSVTVDGGGSEAVVSTLSPGEQVSVDAGQLQGKRPLDIATANAWPRGDLIFKNRRLDSLLEEMNRYSKTPLRLADPALASLTVSGVFHNDDQAALIAALE